MKNGDYELVVAPEDYPGKLYRDRYAYEHRVVWWQETGSLPSGEIHHISGDKRDNRFENLADLSREEHAQKHSQGITMVRFDCPTCGNEFVRARKQTHLVKRKNNATYCSSSCAGKAASQEQEPDQTAEVFVADQSNISSN
jgi:predicted RNA-binding Zn-ribbon protein involved in translation (DUF1610 family)